jgi:hypothetical protein
MSMRDGCSSRVGWLYSHSFLLTFGATAVQIDGSRCISGNAGGSINASYRHYRQIASKMSAGGARERILRRHKTGHVNSGGWDYAGRSVPLIPTACWAARKL